MDYKISYAENITQWEEALPLGNGEMGCLIWGSPAHLRFSLDRTDIWDKTPAKGTDSPEFTYQNMVKLAREGNNEEIRRIFCDTYFQPVPTKLPAGKIILEIKGYEKVCSCLQLKDGQALLQPERESVQINSDVKTGKGEAPLLRSVVHATRGVGMISVNLPLSRLSVNLETPEFGRISSGDEASQETEEASDEGQYGETAAVGSLKSVCYPAPVRKRTPWEEGYLESVCQPVDEDFFYGVVMGVRETREKTEIFYRVVTSEDAARYEEALSPEGQSECGDSFAAAEQQILKLLQLGYDGLLPEHRAWWEEFWEKSSITLPDKFMEKNWYLTNYLLASCSREGYYPMPLQGVWTADADILPPWKGDYHHDLNTQLSYYHYLKANHLPQGKSFVDFLWNSREAGRAFAERFYGTKGQCLPAVMSIDGKPLGGWAMYSLSPTNQIWLCKVFDDYYRYTGDEEFLKERAYPYFREVAECFNGLLEEGADGLLYLPISSSPEIHDDNLEAFLTPNSNYDLALLHYLYKTLEAYGEKLQCAEAEHWKKMQEKLSPLAVDERGVLMLAKDEVLAESHRHHSHAMAVHPLRLISYDIPENRRIIDATIKNLDDLGTRAWCGYSFAWMAEFYAIAHRGAQAAERLRIFWRNFCSSNGFHLNGDQKGEGYADATYKPFTLEGNFCAADALQEMLLYGEQGEIEVFPAVPEKWLKDGVSFEGLRTEGGLLVSARAQDGKLCRLVLEAPGAMEVKLKGWSREGLREDGCVYSVSLQPGENVMV